MEYQSRNSDLLLPYFMESQIKNALRYYRTGLDLQMHRLTVFVTHKCNMFCDYCMGPHLTWRQSPTRRKKMLREDLSARRYAQYLEEVNAHVDHVEHVHFTGGEASVKGAELVQMVQETTARGFLSSITTNGLAQQHIYDGLIDAGLTEVRISIDSAQADVFNQTVRVKGAFERVVANIANLVARRRQGQDVFLVLNACVDEGALDSLEETLSFLLAQDANDVKLLAIVQDKYALAEHNPAQIIQRLSSLLDHEHPQRYWLLRRKIERLFEPEASGLMDDDAQKHVRRCFIPMTERTIDGQHYYPCSIYVRHYGEPLGDLDEPFEVQQQKTMAFVEQHDCRQDPICRQFCVNCCKVYNILMNLAVEAQDAIVETGEVIEHHALDVPEGLAAWLHQTMRAISAPLDVAPPFLILKPHGVDWLEECLACVEEEYGLTVVQDIEIEHFSSLAPMLYARDGRVESLEDAMLISAAFRAAEPCDTARLIVLEETMDDDVLMRIKYKLRARFPSYAYQFQGKDYSRRIVSTVVHVSDHVERDREWALIQAYLGA